MRRILGVFLFAFAVLFGTFLVPALAEAPDSQPQSQPQGQQAQPATVVKLVVKRPPRTVHRRTRLHVPSQPSTLQVRQIIDYEASLWGVSAAALSNRAYCESRYHWWATNGQYVGVLQFGPNAFYRGLATIRTRRIAMVTTRARAMHSRVYSHWSDGTVTRHRGRVVLQRVVTKRVGMLPRSPSMSNAWVQIRIGAQAIRGISAVHSSEWSCAA